ncbi:MAG: tRNA (adenosine(37)-N6)-threonylcarbamoyltransferase complex dimerization subunit type 1 TsaB [Butyribacter sp.]|nr:tRNA (adenosine(37)-N6)-threonylcarbamoyltransferase complex dimerization subunit type 1 TsaB [bacterium]MDY3854235.1 tRNA (adenosine(37)-N6)-threonylcarbamoyltransferase complex dimerization subunit type 1 TsaB [Butyribacter sp.]
MKILGIDTSGLVASAAIVVDDSLVAEFTLNNKKTHSQTLLPTIEQMVTMSGISLEEIDAIAIAAGPGSFTGLRIGASTAKGMGLALQKPIISIPTLEGLAYRAAVSDRLLCPLMDARRNQVYTGLYRMENDSLVCVSDQEAVDINEIISKINDLGQDVLFLGDGVPVHQETLAEKVTVPYHFAPAHLSRQSAGAIAALGRVYYEQGKTEDAKDHRPVYLRQSQAERERAQRLAKEAATE